MLKSIGEYDIRTYEEGDEIELARLFNSVYQGYTGFVPRTLEYWRWSCLDRPDVEKEGIIVVVSKGRIVAYAVVGKSGNIWELCCDTASSEEAVVASILNKAIDYLAKADADSVTLNLPSEDFVAKEACEELGFVKVPPWEMFLSVVDFKQLLELLSLDKKDALRDFREVFLISLKDAPSWISPHIWIKIENGRIAAEEVHRPYKVLVEVDPTTLTSILFGSTRPLSALLASKLKIRPLRKLKTVLKLFSLLRIHDPRFVPRSDLG